MIYGFSILSKNSLFDPPSQKCFIVFSPQVCIAVGFISRSMNHFKLIFVCDIRNGSEFLCFHLF
jgi:hypothetical protein